MRYELSHCNRSGPRLAGWQKRMRTIDDRLAKAISQREPTDAEEIELAEQIKRACADARQEHVRMMRERGTKSQEDWTEPD